jgi:endonuclease/exonuclease/phosphatase (EEP) superfamily protein YafD
MTQSLPSRSARWRLLARRVLFCLSSLYFAALLLVWLLLANAGDRWWPATGIMFAPRWIWGLPLALLIPAALVLSRRLLWLLLGAATMLVFPVMGLCLPWQIYGAEAPPEAKVRLFSLNVHWAEKKLTGLPELIAETDPDIVVLQGCSNHAPAGLFQEQGWHAHCEGQFCLGSRFPILETSVVESPNLWKSWVRYYRLDAPGGSLHLFNLHLETPREGLVAVRHQGLEGGETLEKNSAIRREQSAAIAQWIGQVEGRVLIAGDFNTPPESAIYREYWSPFVNAFSQAGLGWGYTFYNNRTATRIDHILGSPGWRCRRCWVGADVGSEHRPVIADMEWLGGDGL